MRAFEEWLSERGLTESQAVLTALFAETVVIILVAIVAYLIARRVLLRLVKLAAGRTKTRWDDALVEAGVFSRLSHLVPAIILHVAEPIVFAGFPRVVSAIETMVFVYMSVIGLTVFDALLEGASAIYRGYEISRRFDIRAVVQIAKVIVYFACGVAILALLLGKSPLVFFSGLGAFTAVLLLVFKDTILGFVAGIQLTINRMVRPGDWIEMPRHGADGDVLDVSLTTVKVQNWDKTISTIPTYALVSESFKNWRGMSESGGRRIKRAVRIDISSIRFCDQELIERFERIECIAAYIQSKRDELTQHNEKITDNSLLINGRHLTNIGTFRAYLENYLRNHPKVESNMTLLVRQLPPTETGLPIEIYVFSNDQDWANYEAIQADIFDHVLASLELFDLRIFQAPSGADLRESVLGLQA